MNTTNQKNIAKRKFFLTYSAIIIIFTSLFSAFFTACITLGKNFTHSNVKSIRTGETTKDDIRKLFGSPWLSGINDGELSWTYGNYEYSLFGERKAKDLVVQFDDKGMVTSYTFSTTEHNE